LRRLVKDCLIGYPDDSSIIDQCKKIAGKFFVLLFPGEQMPPVEKTPKPTGNL
jgi:hypothetical protein